jgi:Protein of unknown function (DUF2865)
MILEYSAVMRLWVRPVLNFVRQSVPTLAFVSFIVATLGSDIAHAEQWECRALEIQMAAAPRSQPSGKSSAQAARYAKAISAQDLQIGKAKSQLRALGCSGSIMTLGGGGGKASCSKINAALRSMNANMAKLKAQYARLSKGGGTVSSREVLRDRYNAAGCGLQDGQKIIEAKVKKEKNPNTNIAAILGDTKAQREERRNSEQKRIAKSLEVPGLDFGGDTYRTLCVRKCDGYYFPISFSTTRTNFKRDTVACESMCPGTEVELFMHKVPEEESEDMVSKQGEPYKAMSYAFAYRRDGVSGDPACRCQAVQGMSIVNNGTAGNLGVADSEAAGTPDETAELTNMVPVPMPRESAFADVYFDRESAADAAGQLTDEDIISVFEPKVAETAADGSIRVVGPVFLPDPSGAIELKVPVRPLVR